MTDGPYRSLPLKKPWRDAAEALTLDAYSTAEALERLEYAVGRTFRDDGCDALVDDLKRAFLGDERGLPLFPETPNQLVERLAREHPFSDLNSRLIRNAASALEDGEAGASGLKNVIARSAREAIETAFADMTEHYQSQATSLERSRLKSGIERARNRVGYQDISDRILRGNPATSSPAPKHGGLDDGVPL